VGKNQKKFFLAVKDEDTPVWESELNPTQSMTEKKAPVAVAAI
jgi:hypothetical protein